MSPEQLLTVREACKRLSLSHTKVYQLLGSGALRSVKIGRARRVPESAVDEWVRLNQKEGI